jgi:hypothetical protein
MSYTLDLGEASVAAQASVLNAYDRRNVFYFDTFTMERKNQLPLIPTLGIELAL